MILVNVSRNPTLTNVFQEQQDLLATLAAFGLPITLVFAGEGLRQLDKTQLAEENLLDMLPGFGVTDIFVSQLSVAQTGFCVSQSRLPCVIISEDELKALARSAQHAINI